MLLLHGYCARWEAGVYGVLPPLARSQSEVRQIDAGIPPVQEALASPVLAICLIRADDGSSMFSQPLLAAHQEYAQPHMEF